MTRKETQTLLAPADAAGSPPGAVAGAAGASAPRVSPERALEHARMRLDVALARLETAAVGILARKSAVETDRRHLAEALRVVQSERDSLKTLVRQAADRLDEALLRAHEALADPEPLPEGDAGDEDAGDDDGALQDGAGDAEAPGEHSGAPPARAGG